MRRLRLLCCVSVCLLAGPRTVGAADAAFAGSLPPGTRLIVGFRVRSLLALAAQDGGMAPPEAVSKMLAQTPLAGFDPLHDADEVLVAVAGEGQNAQALVTVTGRFGAAAFSKGTKRHGALILDRPNQQAMALVDANTVLGGDAALVRAAIDGGKTGGADAALAARAAELRGQYDIWGVVMPEASPDPWGSIDRLAFGAKLTHGLECFADLHARTAADLEKLTWLLRPLGNMMKSQPAADGGIHLTMSIPEEALKQAIATQRAAFGAGLANALATKPKLPEKPAVVRSSSGDMVVANLPGRP